MIDVKRVERGLMNYSEIETVFNAAYKPVFTIDGGTYRDFLENVIELCEVLKQTDTDEFVWSSVGEFGEACLGDFLAGAYWHLTEWHAGQTSLSYAAMCAIGSIYSPGMVDGPEPDTGESATFEMLDVLAREENGSGEQ